MWGEETRARLLAAKRIKGSDNVAVNVMDLNEALEEIERLRRMKSALADKLSVSAADLLKERGLSMQFERERDEWRDTARSEMAGRRAAEAEVMPSQIMLALRLGGMPENRVTTGEIAAWLHAALRGRP